MPLINIPTFEGLTLNGTYRGTRIEHGKADQNGQPMSIVKCGISLTKTGNYGTEETVTEIVISQALVKLGVAAKLADFEGQQISLPVWQRVWSGHRNNGVSLYLANEVTEMFSKAS